MRLPACLVVVVAGSCLIGGGLPQAAAQDVRSAPDERPDDSSPLSSFRVYMAKRALEILPPPGATERIIREVRREHPAGVGSLRRPTADPGPEVPVGSDKHVPLSHLPEAERMVGENNLLPIAFLEGRFVTQKSVGRITLIEPHLNWPRGTGWGTAFLVGESLLITNQHVMPDKAFAKKTVVLFNFQDGRNGLPEPFETYRFDASDGAFFLTSAELDYSIVRVLPAERVASSSSPSAAPQLHRTAPGSVWGYLRLRSEVLYADRQPVNIIQHPEGRSKHIALQDNQITHVYNNLIRYTTDTMPASSGSPVFNNDWDVVALHRAGGDRAPEGEWLNNEGIRVDRIVEDIRRQLAADPERRSVLQELGL